MNQKTLINIFITVLILICVGATIAFIIIISRGVTMSGKFYTENLTLDSLPDNWTINNYTTNINRWVTKYPTSINTTYSSSVTEVRQAPFLFNFVGTDSSGKRILYPSLRWLVVGMSTGYYPQLWNNLAGSGDVTYNNTSSWPSMSGCTGGGTSFEFIPGRSFNNTSGTSSSSNPGYVGYNWVSNLGQFGKSSNDEIGIVQTAMLVVPNITQCNNVNGKIDWKYIDDSAPTNGDLGIINNFGIVDCTFPQPMNTPDAISTWNSGNWTTKTQAQGNLNFQFPNGTKNYMQNSSYGSTGYLNNNGIKNIQERTGNEPPITWNNNDGDLNNSQYGLDFTGYDILNGQDSTIWAQGGGWCNSSVPNGLNMSNCSDCNSEICVIDPTNNENTCFTCPSSGTAIYNTDEQRKILQINVSPIGKPYVASSISSSENNPPFALKVPGLSSGGWPGDTSNPFTLYNKINTVATYLDDSSLGIIGLSQPYIESSSNYKQNANNDGWNDPSTAGLGQNTMFNVRAVSSYTNAGSEFPLSLGIVVKDGWNNTSAHGGYQGINSWGSNIGLGPVAMPLLIDSNWYKEFYGDSYTSDSDKLYLYVYCSQGNSNGNSNNNSDPDPSCAVTGASNSTGWYNFYDKTTAQNLQQPGTDNDYSLSATVFVVDQNQSYWNWLFFVGGFTQQTDGSYFLFAFVSNYEPTSSDPINSSLTGEAIFETNTKSIPPVYYPTDIGVSPFFNVVPDGNGGVTPGFSGAIGAGYPVGCATTIDKFTNPSSNCMTNFVLRFMNPCISADHNGFPSSTGDFINQSNGGGFNNESGQTSCPNPESCPPPNFGVIPGFW